MDITASIQLTAAERTELARIVGCAPAELPNKLQAIATASLLEYVSMFRGQKVFRRGSDIHEYRLFLLIQSALDNRIPDEQHVSRLFQTTSNESRSLIRSVMSKYQYQLKVAVEQSMRQVVEGAEQGDDDGPFTVPVNSLNVVDELNRVLADLDGTLQPVVKRKGSVSIYELSPASHARLKQHFGIA